MKSKYINLIVYIIAISEIYLILKTSAIEKTQIFAISTISIMVLTTSLVISDSIKRGNFTMIAGYDSKQKYNENVLKSILNTISATTSFLGLIYLSVIGLLYLVKNYDLTTYLTLAFILSQLLSIVIINAIRKKELFRDL